MSMNVGQATDEEDQVVSAINTTPLVDVMLVLLIIFLITIPVVTTSIKVRLPHEQNQIRITKPENVIISVDRAGRVYIYDTPVRGTRDLIDRMKVFAKKDPQPDVQIRGDGDASYEGVGRVIYAVQRSGITKVGFITDPTSIN